jgi:citrate lyase subunit beta/citryl-CoA lyase
MHSTPKSELPPRSWLFAPGHSEKLLHKVFDAGADIVILDLEDAVPPEFKDRARALVAEVAAAKPCWVRVNRPQTDLCALDLGALVGKAQGLRLPKVESAADVAWTVDRAARIALDCTIETARGVVAATEIAAAEGCSSLSYGGADLASDLGVSGTDRATLFARSAIVVASRAAGRWPPSDGVYTHIYDDDGLRAETVSSRELGFFGKSAIHPRQIPIIHEAFLPTAAEVAWAEQVIAAFEASRGAATALPNGEFVDLAVVNRARNLRFRAVKSSHARLERGAVIKVD